MLNNIIRIIKNLDEETLTRIYKFICGLIGGQRR